MKQAELTKIDEGIWTVEGEAPLMPGVILPCRATIVRLEDGSLLIHSPVTFSEETAAAIGRLGEVRALLSPNIFHHLFLEAAKKQFPDACIVATEGLEKKSKKIQVDETIGEELPSWLASDFAHVEIKGAAKFNEVVLLHRKTRSLIVGDYFFNIQETRGLFTPLLLKFTGSYKKRTQSKLWRMMADDREALAQSADRVLSLDYERIIMCHGDTIEDGREFSKDALAWLNSD